MYGNNGSSGLPPGAIELSSEQNAFGRTCGTCTVCCKALKIDQLNKPRDVLCTHCQVGQGCGIYSSRPEACRQFRCKFLSDPALKEAWRPSKSRILLVASPDGGRIAAHVDPERPGAWRREPFYSQLKKWSRELALRQGQIFVTLGKRTIVILPDREVDLGIVEDDELIINEYRNSPSGLLCEALKIKRDDPRARHLSPE